jgi:hypothetical protein
MTPNQAQASMNPVRRIRMKTPPFLHRPAAALLLGLSSLPAQAFDDGARAFFLVPDGTRILTFNTIVQEGNQTLSLGQVVAGSDLDITAGFVQYTQTFEFGGQQAGVFAALPYARIEGSLASPLGTIEGNESGAADPVIGAIFGLTGAPNLGLKDYVQYDPGFGAGLLFKLTVPVGSYDSNRTLNVGGNRWAFQVGVPMSYNFGSSLVDPDMTLLELAPSLTVFSDNDDPSGGASNISQDPLFRLEAHVSHNLSQTVWVSADALFSYGAETTTDGVSDNNTKKSLGLGATVNFAVSDSTQIKITYGEIVSSNNNGADGRGIRLVASMLF